jgi:hypothetical protein
MRTQIYGQSLQRRYGITVDDYRNMAEEQNGRCAICNDIPMRQLDVDHCHNTGQVRELLCLHCNRGLGGFKDSADLVSRALDYLLKHGQQLPRQLDDI